MTLWQRARRPWLLPLVPLYASAIALRNSRYTEANRGRRLARPVVSVGSISAGGAGKTPFVIALAGLLQQDGVAVDVLSRGHGRRSREVLRVDPMGDARIFGDEPLLIAQSSGCPVYVGADRFAAGQLAEQQIELPGAHATPHVHLLDDGFQHRQLARDVDIVLLTLEETRDLLLPAGNRREEFESLLRAGIVVVREEEQMEICGFLREQFGRLPHLWLCRRVTTLAQPFPDAPLLFSGIARPAEFVDAIFLRAAACGQTLRGHLQFDDHQSYGSRQIALLLDRARSTGARSFITTEKDAVKLTPAMRQRLGSIGPLHVAGLRTELLEPAPAMRELRLLLGLRRSDR